MTMAGNRAGFESFYRGSWWDVRILEQRGSMFLVSLNADKDVSNEGWVSLKELRLSSRRCDGWDCNIFRRGIDVAVLSKHPKSNTLNVQKEGLYDARIQSVARTVHSPRACTCKFSIQFFGLETRTAECCGSLLERVLLTDEPETQVSISEVRILQMPSATVPFQTVLDAHVKGERIPLYRGCKDAYFLTETDLRSFKMSLRVSSHEVDPPSPASVRTDEVLSGLAPRVSMKNGEEGSNCNPAVDGQDVDIIGTDNGEDGYRTPKPSPGVPETPEQPQSEGPPSININHKSASARDHDADAESDGVAERGPKRKRGRPRWRKPAKAGTRVDQNGDLFKGILDAEVPKKDDPRKKTGEEEEAVKTRTRGRKRCNAPNVTSTPGPKLNESLGKFKYYTLEKRPEPGVTETINVSSDDDEASEYKPMPYVKYATGNPYNTREKIKLRKPKTEEEQPNSGLGRGLKKELRSSLYGNRFADTKNSPDKHGKRVCRNWSTSETS